MVAKKLFFLIGDGLLLVFSVYAACRLKFDGQVPPAIWTHLPLLAAVSLAVKLPVFSSQRLHMLSWSQVGLEDMMTIFFSVTLGAALFWFVASLLRYAAVLPAVPLSVFVIDYFITLDAVAGFRAIRRIYANISRRTAPEGRVALIVGAGLAGEQLALSLKSTRASGYLPIGFVDDDRAKLGARIRGLRVLGTRDRLPELIGLYKVQAVLIAMPSAPSGVIRNVVSLAREAGVHEIRIVPGLDRMLSGQVGFGDLRDVQVADLLGRQVVHIHADAVTEWLGGRKVLVTGAAGSIGSELARQIARFHPDEIVLVDNNETDLFWIEQDLRRLGQRYSGHLEDVRHASRIAALFERVRPDVVFHAAALKHVAMMERHPDQAVRTNMLGTLSVAEAALAANTERFVLISTDKAVNPTSVMGATKSFAEQLCLALNGRGATRYMAVRFGNVLGSRGSVVPVFQDRIRRGEAITVRGADTRRYFMAVSEAVLLVLQAGAMGQGGEVFVLDMGDPVRIADLACELIRLSGLTPYQDVPIIFTEPLPGEKESEELVGNGEIFAPTRHEQILMARHAATVDVQTLIEHVGALDEMAQRGDLNGIVRALRKIVPTYHPSPLFNGEMPVSASVGVLSAASDG